MVDQIGAKPSIGREITVARIAQAMPTTATQGTTQSASGPDTASLANVAQSLAASPPVDAERVARIRKAIADGKFPLLPSTVADRLIALKLQWNPNDKA